MLVFAVVCIAIGVFAFARGFTATELEEEKNKRLEAERTQYIYQQEVRRLQQEKFTAGLKVTRGDSKDWRLFFAADIAPDTITLVNAATGAVLPKNVHLALETWNAEEDRWHRVETINGATWRLQAWKEETKK